MSEPATSIFPDGAATTLPVAREKILEYRLAADLACVMLRRGVELEILRGDCDAHGHDIVFEANSIIRHVQLKATITGGKRRDISVNVRLRSKPSGCVIWIIYNPETFEVEQYLWFGDAPGEPLPYLEGKVARHSKGNADGIKLLRSGHRLLSRPKFARVDHIDELADRLFGPPRTFATHLVLAQLRHRHGAEWRYRVHQDVNKGGWERSIELAHLVDGYAVLEQLGVTEPEAWIESEQRVPLDKARRADIGYLWTALFMEHRRSKYVGYPIAGPEISRLDELVSALHRAIEADL